jgi:short-subunit dehydrogenase
MNQVALITGASVGIGYEIALQFAQHKTDILIIARNDQKLKAIKDSVEKEFQIKVYTLAVDLSTPESIEVIRNYVITNQLTVTYLVNNAGFGDYGNFTERSMKNYQEMISLNILSLTALTHYFAGEMVKQGKGSILNVASTAGFQPDPYFAVYGATKAYVISFTEALHKELENTGVTTTVLSPGPTLTEFTVRADMLNAKLFKHGVMSAKKVAQVGYKGLINGKLHVVPGFKNKIASFFSSMVPSSKFRLNVVAAMIGRKGH